MPVFHPDISDLIGHRSPSYALGIFKILRYFWSTIQSRWRMAHLLEHRQMLSCFSINLYRSWGQALIYFTCLCTILCSYTYRMMIQFHIFTVAIIAWMLCQIHWTVHFMLFDLYPNPIRPLSSQQRWKSGSPTVATTKFFHWMTRNSWTICFELVFYCM